MRVLVTGATGFIGRNLCPVLSARGWQVRAACRRQADGILPVDIECVSIDGVGPKTEWSAALAGVDVVVHLAGRAHVLHENSKDPLEAFRSINTLGTVQLARSAVSAGVRRFVFLSSIKVHGESTSRPLTEESPLSLDQGYGQSKWEAEEELRSIASSSGMEVTVLRPPLVYGPHVKARFLSLLRAAHRSLPLPLAGVRNRRSFVFVNNLNSAICACLEHPGAAGETFLVSDGEDVSTAELVQRLACHMNAPVRLWRFPEKGLRWAGALLGKGEEVSRVLDSLQVDSVRIRRKVDWLPPYTVAEGLEETALWYASHARREV